MAKLTKTDAAKMIGVARQTIYDYIKEGRISADPDGRIDTAELIRAGYELRLPDSQEDVVTGHTPTPKKGEFDTSVAPPPDQIHIKKFFELYEQQITSLERELSDAKKREERLLGMLEQTQKQLFLPPPSAHQQGSFWSRLFSRKGTKPV